MKKEYQDVKEYMPYLAKQIKNEVKGIFSEMYKFGKLAFGKNLMSNLEKIRKDRIESKIKYCWEK